MNNEFPTDLRQFISQSIESLAQMEVLLLLHRHSAQVWTPEEVAKTLYIAREMSAILLADLTQRGFAVSHPSGFQYAAATSVQPMVDQLAQAYLERRVAVISEIYSKPQSKVQTFADSFRLRKED